MSEEPRHGRIPVTPVTGLLGIGKTTLINAGPEPPGHSRTAVVVNEFSEVDLDHRLCTSSNGAAVVLENGCPCRAVRSDAVGTLNGLYHDRTASLLPDFGNVEIQAFCRNRHSTACARWPAW